MKNSVQVRPITVSEFQAMFHDIYTPANERYSDPDLMLHFIEETSAVMELARKDEIEKMPSQISRVYSWVNAVASRLKINLQEALWNKYPNVCPYCLRFENCLCAVEHPDIPEKELKLRKFRRDKRNMPVALYAHQDLHRRLYSKQNRRILIIQTAAHLAEEAGEVSKEFRHKNREKIQNEIADVLSWTFAIANRCGFELADIVWDQFPFECESCHSSPCINLTGHHCQDTWS